MTRSNGRWVVNKGFKTCYKRMCWDAPAPTVTRNFMTASSDNNLHPDQNRTLSPAEVMRLQTVDRYSYDWGEAPTDRILRDALGDAVPPLFLEKLTRHLAAISTRSTDPVKYPDARNQRACPIAL
ncbi:MAG: DNA cytosine methyltransferase [Proteobacteria bacterium]|nr:DNA cytosine methyltransferase [Pseudomonadota bacterium]